MKQIITNIIDSGWSDGEKWFIVKANLNYIDPWGETKMFESHACGECLEKVEDEAIKRVNKLFNSKE